MDIVIIRGGGDIATGIAHRLYGAGFKIVILEVEEPTSIRRKVSFSEAVYDKEAIVEGVKGVRVDDPKTAYKEIEKGNIAVLVDGEGRSIEDFQPIAIVDSILAKKNLGMSRELAENTIALGPGFEAGLDVDIVIETMRGHDLGRLIHKGRAEDNTSIPGTIMGYSEERVIRAPKAGRIENLKSIGDRVEEDTALAKIGEEYIYPEIPGVIRGLIRDGLFVEEGMKIGDVDPRGIEEYAFTISDKARSLGGAVLEALIYLLRRKDKC